MQRLGAEDSPLKAKTLGGLARYWAVTGEQQKAMVYAPKAVAMARRFGDPELIAYSLVGMLYALMGPEHAEQRLAIATEMLDLAKAANATRTVATAQFWRGYCLLELGDTAGADAEFDAYGALGGRDQRTFASLPRRRSSVPCGP